MTGLESLNREVAERVMGWRWFAIDVSSPRYPNNIRARHFLSPEHIASPRWKTIFLEQNGAPAVGDEPLHDPFDESLTKTTALPDFATDIAAAFEVVEKVCKDHRKNFWCELAGESWETSFYQFNAPTGGAVNASLPEAICRAALQVVGAET